ARSCGAPRMTQRSWAAAMTRARRVALLALTFYALVDELIGHAVFRILARLQVPRMVAELTGAKLELRNDVRILTGHGDHGLWVEHVCNQHPDAHVRPSLAERLMEQPKGCSASVPSCQHLARHYLLRVT